jgi:hypothetical protein
MVESGVTVLPRLKISMNWKWRTFLANWSYWYKHKKWAYDLKEKKKRKMCRAKRNSELRGDERTTVHPEHSISRKVILLQRLLHQNRYTPDFCENLFLFLLVLLHPDYHTFIFIHISIFILSPFHHILTPITILWA